MATIEELSRLDESLSYIIEHRALKDDKFQALRHNCMILKQSARNVFSYASEYTYGGIQANGYTTYLKVLLRFAELVERSLRGKAYLGEDLRLNLASRCLLNYWRQLEQFRARSHLDPNYDIHRVNDLYQVNRTTQHAKKNSLTSPSVYSNYSPSRCTSPLRRGLGSRLLSSRTPSPVYVNRQQHYQQQQQQQQQQADDGAYIEELDTSCPDCYALNHSSTPSLTQQPQQQQHQQPTPPSPPPKMRSSKAQQKLQRKRSLLAPPEYRKVEFFHYYRSEKEELSALYGYYNSFWLSTGIRFMHNFIAFMVALFANLPYSLSVIWNRERRGQLIWQSLYNATVTYPFKVWNITEYWFYRKALVWFYNLLVPTKSSTLQVPRQRRFRLNRLGGLMDLNDPHQKYLVNILDDQEEKRRQNYPTGQHKNGDHIRCRLIQCTRVQATGQTMPAVDAKAAAVDEHGGSNNGDKRFPLRERKRTKSVNFNESFNKKYSEQHQAAIVSGTTDEYHASIESQAADDNTCILVDLLQEQQQRSTQADNAPSAQVTIIAPRSNHADTCNTSIDDSNRGSKQDLQAEPESAVPEVKFKNNTLKKITKIWKRKKPAELHRQNQNTSSTNLAKKAKSRSHGSLLNLAKIFKNKHQPASIANIHAEVSHQLPKDAPIQHGSSASTLEMSASEKGQQHQIPEIIINASDCADLDRRASEPSRTPSIVITSELSERNSLDSCSLNDLPDYTTVITDAQQCFPLLSPNMDDLNKVNATNVSDDNDDVFESNSPKLRRAALSKGLREKPKAASDEHLSLVRKNRHHLDSSSDQFYQNLTQFLNEEHHQAIAEEFAAMMASKRKLSLSEKLAVQNQRHTIVLHAHGGGFLAHSPDSHELYLRRWVSKLGPIPMISVDYSLSVAYPVALQEVLDVYLWLISGSDDVKKTFGFQPERIVVCGDSAGGMLCLILLLVLNDLNQMLQERTGEQIMLPHAFVGFYPAFTATSLSPSKLLAKMEPVLSIISPLMTVIGVYSAGIYDVSDFKRIERSPEYRAMLASNSNTDELRSGLADHTTQAAEAEGLAARLEGWQTKLRRLSILGWPLRLVLYSMQSLYQSLHRVSKYWWPSYVPWYVCDGDTYDRRTNYLVHMLNHPYGSPLVYQYFEQLSGVKLYLITSHFDVLLDDNIELARKWKGPVNLDVLDGVPHGFLYYTYISKEAYDASEICLKRLQQACDL